MPRFEYNSPDGPHHINFAFALGPGANYLYAADTALYWDGLGTHFDKLWRKNIIRNVQWASFGADDADEPCAFISFMDVDGKRRFVWTDSIPIQLKIFLEQNGSRNFFPKEPLNYVAEREDLRVVFGPNNSFIAWDDTQIEWHDIPENLGSKLCAWREEYGDEGAMPRLVALGAQGAWFVVSKAGKAAYHFPEHGFELLWQDIAKVQAREDFAWKDLDFFTVHPTMPDRYIIVESGFKGFRYQIENGLEDFERTMKLLGKAPTPPHSPPPGMGKNGGKAKEGQESKEKHKQQEQEPKKKDDTKQQQTGVPLAYVLRDFKARDATEMNLKQGKTIPILEFNTQYWWTVRKGEWRAWVPADYLRIIDGGFDKESPSANGSSSGSRPWEKPNARANRMTDIYQQWRARVDIDFKKPTGTLTAFPPIPAPVVVCKQVSCLSRKCEPLSLGACVHDVGTLLRGNTTYSAGFLKQARNAWHPDRMMRMCVAGKREEFKVKSEMMFKILTELFERQEAMEREQADKQARDMEWD